MSGWGIIYDNMMAGLQNHSQTLARIQEQIATGKRVLRASDAPTDTYQILGLQSRSSLLETYTANITRLAASQQQAYSSLQGVSTSLARVKTQLTLGASDNNAAQRSIIG